MAENGSMNGDVRILQLLAAGVISRRTALEKLGIVKDVDKEMRRIEEEQWAAVEKAREAK